MNKPLGIVIQASGSRYGRERIDLPLALASLDLPIRVFVLDDAVYDLRAGQDGENAWSRLWQALIDMSDQICVARSVAQNAGDELPSAAVLMDDRELARAMAACGHLLHV